MDFAFFDEEFTKTKFDITNTIIILTYLCLAFTGFEGGFIYINLILVTSQIGDIIDRILEMGKKWDTGR